VRSTEAIAPTFGEYCGRSYAAGRRSLLKHLWKDFLALEAGAIPTARQQPVEVPECEVVGGFTSEGRVCGVPSDEIVEAGIELPVPSCVGAPMRRIRLEVFDFLL
jgi:hypothetical protein